jgi:hypothetical protein
MTQFEASIALDPSDAPAHAARAVDDFAQRRRRPGRVIS